MQWNEIKEKQYNYDKDASYDTWEYLYKKVYSKIDIFKNNFDFDKPSISGNKYKRIMIKAKEDSQLKKNYKDLLQKKGVPIDKMKCEFLVSGDTDFNIEEECHRFDNYSLMPVTGSLNNEKGRTNGEVEDIFPIYIQKLPELIDNPTSYNGGYKEELKEHAKNIVICARQAYWSLFGNNIETYFLNTYLYGVNNKDEIYKEAMELFQELLKYEKDKDETKIANDFWNIRRQILKSKYNLNLNEAGKPL